MHRHITVVAVLCPLVLLSLATSSHASAITLVTTYGDLLLPNRPNQEVDVYVSSQFGTSFADYVFMNAQIGDGGPPVGGSTVGPSIAGDLLGPGTLFHDNNIGDIDLGSVPLGFYDYTQTQSGTVSISMGPVLLLRLFVNTTGFYSFSPGDLGPGKWSLNMLNTANGSTDVGGLPMNPSSTFIQIVVPEPSTLALAAIALASLLAFGWRRIHN